VTSRAGGRVYWRKRGRNRRAYADFRDYADVGGKQEALTPHGEKIATSDPDIAQALVAARLKELDDLRRGRALHGDRKRATLQDFASDHLVSKRKAGKVTIAWLETRQQQLVSAIGFFGAGRDLESLRVSDVKAWASHLSTGGGARGKPLSPGSVRHYLFALSDLYGTAQEEEVVPPGYNPVSAWRHKPTVVRREARWLELDEAALLLESARTLPPLANCPEAFDSGLAYPLLATFLLTGGRKAEILGLAVDDISFDRKTVTFRPHPWRRLKTGTSLRVVPLWPQLEAILRPHVFRADRPIGRLLFPSFECGEEGAIVEIRKLLDRIAVRAGWQPGEIRSRAFRHTYTAARLQTLDQGAPVSIFTVSRELGHGGDSLVKRVYGHLGQVRHRAEVVEYPIEACEARLIERLVSLR
jgi:integrase